MHETWNQLQVLHVGRSKLINYIFYKGNICDGETNPSWQWPAGRTSNTEAGVVTFLCLLGVEGDGLFESPFSYKHCQSVSALQEAACARRAEGSRWSWGLRACGAGGGTAAALPVKGCVLSLSSLTATGEMLSSWSGQAEVTASGHVLPRGEEGEETLAWLF